MIIILKLIFIRSVNARASILLALLPEQYPYYYVNNNLLTKEDNVINLKGCAHCNGKPY